MSSEGLGTPSTSGDAVSTSLSQSFSARAKRNSEIDQCAMRAKLPAVLRLFASIAPLSQAPLSKLENIRSFSELTELFPKNEIKLLREKFGEEAWQELNSIFQEKNSEMFFQELLDFGGRLESSDKIELAAQVYSIFQEAPASPIPNFPLIAKQADTRLNAILGKASVGARFEFLLGRAAHETTDYHNILPALASSMVFNVGSSLALGKLSGLGQAWYSRGLGARALSGLFGFSLEVNTFSFLNRGLKSLSDGGVAWDGASIGKDLLSATLSLGALKLCGFLGNQAFLKTHGLNELGVATRLPAFTRLSQSIFPQASTFVGMMASHRLEEAIGLRPHVDGATTVLDTLSSMVTLGIGMHLGGEALGPGFANFQMEMGMRGKIFSQFWFVRCERKLRENNSLSSL